MKRSITSCAIYILCGLSCLLPALVSAAPATAPDGVSSAAGIFATYFQNLANNPCTGTSVITGFSAAANTAYVTPGCVTIGSLLGSFLGSYGTATLGEAVVGFNPTTGAPVFGVAGRSFSGWSLTGNINTNASVNFIGTQDAQDVVFKSKNIQGFRLTSSGNIVGLGAGNVRGTASSSLVLGSSGGELMNGNSQTVLGGVDGGYGMAGSYNSAYGGRSAGYNMAGSANVGLGGYYAGNTMGGYQSTAIGGYQVGVSMTGTNNTALGGYYAGNAMVGFGNTAIGGYSPTILNPGVQYSVVIGSGARSNRSGAVVIGGSGSNVGIGNPNPTYKLDVNGDLRSSTDIQAGGMLRSNSGVLFAPNHALVDIGGWAYLLTSTGVYSNGLAVSRIFAAASVSAPSLCLGNNCISSWSTVGQWANITGGIAYTGGNVGIGTSSLTYPLNVAGTGSFGAIRITGGSSNNYVLASDASGNARWVSTGSLISATVETDPIWIAQKPSYATLASPALTGTPSAPTAVNATNTTQLATTAFVKNQGYITNASETDPIWIAQKPSYATLASPALTGTPTAPTPATANNSTQLATTAFVKSQGYLTAAAPETDPQVGAITNNYVSKWNGSALVNSQIIDGGGTISVNNDLTVSTSGGAHSFIFMADDQSPNGRKIIHANSNVLGFMNGAAGFWLSYWDNAGNQSNGGAITSPSYLNAPLYYDYNNTAYYVDPSSVSITNDMRANIFYDYGNTNYYVDPNATSRLNYGVFDNIYSYSTTYLPFIYDQNDYGYYIDPNSTSRMNNIYANNYYYISDARLKENAVPLSGALDKLGRINGYTYNWKDTGKKSMGIMAQEVEKEFPDIVSTDEKTGLKSVQYGNLVAPLIEAIKEQQQQIDTLKKEIEELKKK